jgi:hypothetical protein
MTFIQVKQTKGRIWTDKEEREAAARVYRMLRDAPGPLTISETMSKLKPMNVEEVLHSVEWMRGQGVKITIFAGAIHEGLPSTIRLEKS